MEVVNFEGGKEIKEREEVLQTGYAATGGEVEQNPAVFERAPVLNQQWRQITVGAKAEQLDQRQDAVV